MRRRDFLGALGAAASAWPLAARGQSSDVRRIGILMPFGKGDAEGEARLRTFMQDLDAAGWTAGRNLHVETRYGSRNAELMRKHVLELASLSPHAILVQSSPLLAQLKQATTTIPIVFVNVTDPVGQGFVRAMASPEGNVTGFTNVEPSMGGKWLEVLKEVAPQLRRVAFVHNPRTAPSADLFLKSFEMAARAHSVEAISAAVNDVPELERAITDLARKPNSGLVSHSDSFTLTNRRVIIEHAAKHKLPAMYVGRSYVAEGGLVAYGIRATEMYQGAARYVDRILRGTSPGQLPVQAPTRFELTINAKAARALGLTISPSLLARADEVIE
jgi:putative tryptophan/tyrosine transport system substrate-binding protein